jgi:pimeloyl-CoA dehydrogenase small subunit
MDFDFTEEQTLLKESVAGLLNRSYGFDKRHKYMEQTKGYSSEVWESFAEQGLLGLPFSEEDGGFGGGSVETLIVMEQLGRNLCLEPYFASVILAGGCLKHGATKAQKEQYLPSLIDGSKVFCFAFQERHSRYDLAQVKTSAKKNGDKFIINGEKGVVLAGDFADFIIVTARTAGSETSRTGIGLFIVDANAKGVSRRGYKTQDGLRAAEISFDNVEAVSLGGDKSDLAVIERVRDEAIAAIAAEITGCFDVMLASTVDYMKTRKQFGVTISSFQALQHKASEMFVSSELMRSMSYYAVAGLEMDAQERAKILSQVKVQVGRSAKFIGEGAIQLHGGVGMTNEYAITHYYKHTTMLNMLFGDADEHLARIA